MRPLAWRAGSTDEKTIRHAPSPGWGERETPSRCRHNAVTRRWPDNGIPGALLAPIPRPCLGAKTRWYRAPRNSSPAPVGCRSEPPASAHEHPHQSDRHTRLISADRRICPRPIPVDLEQFVVTTDFASLGRLARCSSPRARVSRWRARQWVRVPAVNGGQEETCSQVTQSALRLDFHVTRSLGNDFIDQGAGPVVVTDSPEFLSQCQFGDQRIFRQFCFLIRQSDRAV